MFSNEMHSNIYERVIEKYNKYRNEYEKTGQIKYHSNNNPITLQDVKAGNVAKIIIVLWLSLIGIIPIVLVHKENISSYISSKPLILLIAIYIFIILSVILLIYYNSKRMKYLTGIRISGTSIDVYYSSKDCFVENKVNCNTFTSRKTVLHIRRSKKKNVDQDTSKRTPFIVLVKCNGKVDRYKLFAYDKCDMLAFLLFLESSFNKKIITNLSPTEIEKMYYSSNFGLKMYYDFSNW